MEGQLENYLPIKPGDIMSELRFSDGVTIQTDGPLRTHRDKDGWYVTGQGMLIPMDSQEAAQKWVEEHGGDHGQQS